MHIRVKRNEGDGAAVCTSVIMTVVPSEATEILSMVAETLTGVSGILREVAET